jgi:hypothetical protein
MTEIAKKVQSVCNESTKPFRHYMKLRLGLCGLTITFPGLANHVSTLFDLLSLFPGHVSVNKQTNKANKHIYESQTATMAARM